MKRFSFVLSTVALLGCLTRNAFASNDFYIVTINRDVNDVSYDKATSTVQDAIDELVNDRMNDIYNIIDENKETFRLDDGQMDNKLDELESNIISKRNENRKKFRFINRNRPERNGNGFSKRDEDFIPLESDLISHIVPVGNNYAVRAYLSDSIVDKVRSLENVTNVHKSLKLEVPNTRYEHEHSTNATQNTESASSSNLSARSEENTKVHYNIEEIKRETGWSDVSVQEHAPPNLSVISQGHYHPTYERESINVEYEDYDENYYYPSTAGKGIDIYYIDFGLTVYHEDFNTYAGTPDERIIKCEGYVTENKFIKANAEQEKNCVSFEYMKEYGIKNGVHGIMVSSVSAGTIYGVAKKANIHMVAIDFNENDIFIGLDYIKRNAKNPHKTVVNISAGCPAPALSSVEDANLLQEKINELSELGFVIVVGSGNDDRYIEKDTYPFTRKVDLFASFANVITVGYAGDPVIGTNPINRQYNMEYVYEYNSFTNHGPAIDLYGPGNSATAHFTKCLNENGELNLKENEVCTSHDYGAASSNATPHVSGIVALLMAENPDIEYNVEIARKQLIDLSLKNVLGDGKKNSSGRFINNGKKILYDPRKKIYDRPTTTEAPVQTTTTTEPVIPTTETPVQTTTVEPVVPTTTTEAPVQTTTVEPVVPTTTTEAPVQTTTTAVEPVVPTTTTESPVQTTTTVEPVVPTTTQEGEVVYETVYVTSVTYTTVTQTFTDVATATVYSC